MRAPTNWRAHGVRGRVIRAPLRRWPVDSTASLRSVVQTLHIDAVEPTVRHRNGSQIARLRVPRGVRE
eukprot:5018251-Lingulodinium_polyedra.AAC.1